MGPGHNPPISKFHFRELLDLFPINERGAGGMCQLRNLEAFVRFGDRASNPLALHCSLAGGRLQTRSGTGQDVIQFGDGNLAHTSHSHMRTQRSTDMSEILKDRLRDPAL